ncbi:MAG: LysR family transcriptional regulator [Lachnospiraceae bacterium]|nr:LysR family transcriptional regulator [Lachnospiraceae bacterium]
MENHLNLYHIFYTVARCQNISGAAKELYISQPAISKAIAKLEQNLDTTLFVRSSRGVRLTEEGELLYRQVDNAFISIRQGEEQLRKMNELGIGRLSIGVSTILCKYILLPYLQNFIHENPHIQISILCQSTFHIIEALEQGTIDIGLIGETSKIGKLHFQPVREIEDIFVSTPSYLNNLKMRGTLPKRAGTLQYLSSGTLMLLDKGNVTRQYIDKYLSSQNIDISSEQLIEATTMDLLIEFAKIDLGIACVIEDFVKNELEDGSLIKLPLHSPIPKRSIGFSYAPNRTPNGALLKFLKYIDRLEGHSAL